MTRAKPPLVVAALVAGARRWREREAAGSASAAKCVPGVQAVGARYVRGLLRAARVRRSSSRDGRTGFRSGECFRSKDFTNVNIGTYTVSGAPLGRYLRVVGPSRDGTTTQGLASAGSYPAYSTGSAVRDLTLEAKGTRGSFSGRTRSGDPCAGLVRLHLR